MENDRQTRIRQRAYQLWLDGGSPEGKQEVHWAQAEREINNGDQEIGSADEPSLGAMREAARQHADAFVVRSDLEDAGEREAAPGTREQP